MNVAILSCNLGNFDTPVKPVDQILPEGIDSATYHCFTYDDFPQIADLPPRFQYRIPKMFGWQMFEGFDYYLWLDGTVSLQREDCLKWYLDQLGDGDMAFFAHPNRKTIQEEVNHIEEHLNLGKPYITARYKNGLHKEQLVDIQLDPHFKDTKLYASTTFIYKDSEAVRNALRVWWLHSSRYFTCDQVALPYVTKDLDVRVLDEPIYKTGYMSLVSHHK